MAARCCCGSTPMTRRRRPPCRHAPRRGPTWPGTGSWPARADHSPRLHVGARQGEDIRRAGRAAGLINTLDQRRLDAQVASKRWILVDRLPEVVLGREWDAREVGEADERRP